MIRLARPSIDEEDVQAVREVLLSGFLVQAGRVRAFEQAVAGIVGCKYAVAVSSGTAALHVALLALDLRPGDFIVTSAYAWPSAANVAHLCGAEPVFVDVLPDTFNIDPSALEETVKRLMASAETAKRVRAIVPIHAFGQLADMPAIIAVAEHYGLPIIEDAACALGATLDGRQAGTWGVMGCFSFHPRKTITTGEGGLVTTDDPDLAKRLRVLRNHGLDPDASKPDFIDAGYNYRLTEFQGALGLIQLGKLERLIQQRRQIARQYNALLSSTRISAPAVPPHHNPVYQSYVVLLPHILTERRSELVDALKAESVETTIGTWHVPLTRYFRTRRGYKPGDYPVTDSVFARSMSLPMYEQLTPDVQRHIVERLETLTNQAT